MCLEATGALQARVSILVPLLRSQRVLHTAAFSSRGSFRASLSLSQPLIFGTFQGKTHLFF